MKSETLMQHISGTDFENTKFANTKSDEYLLTLHTGYCNSVNFLL
jgi:hypothetical protein